MRNYLVGAVMTVGLVLGGASMASASTLDPGAIAGDLASTSGGAVLNAIVDVLPALVPILVAFWAVGFVWKKVKPRSGGIS